MRSAFYRAVVRCRLRRLEQVACAAPLPALAATVAVAAAPFLLWRAGAAVGNGLATAIGSPAVANALVLGPALAAAAAGVVVTVSLPGRSALGAQLAASPCRRGDAIVAGLLVPAGLFAIVVLPSLVAVCVALAEPLPGGAPAGLALVVACLAAVPTGGIVVEGVFGLLRRDRRAVGFATGLLVSWPLAGSVAGAAPLGPLAPVARALEGSRSAGGAFAAAALVAVGLGAVWLALVACRPAPRSRRTRRTRALVGGGASLAIPTAGAVILARRTDVRVATAASLGFGLAGVVVADASSGGVSPFLLATTTTLFGSIVPSLAVGGVIASGRWLWLRRRPGPTGVAATTGVVGIAGSAVPVVVVGLAAAGASDATRAAVGFVAAVVVLGASSALLAGALVPWRPVGIGDQLTTFAALGAVAIALALVLGLAGPRLTGIGVPAAVVVVAAASLSVVVALLALDRRLRSEAQ